MIFVFVYITEENLKINKNATIGDMVAATSLYYDETHRAVILDKNPKHYFCFFIDIGCKEYVNLNNVFYLLEEAKNVSYFIIIFLNIYNTKNLFTKYIKVHKKYIYIYI